MQVGLFYLFDDTMLNTFRRQFVKGPSLELKMSPLKMDVEVEGVTGFY